MATKAKAKALKKITVRDLMGRKLKNEEKPKEGESLHVCDIWGQARRLITGETDFGPYVKFKGAFEGVAVVGDKAGELFRAPNLILPDVAADELEGMLSQPGVSSVDFAIRISVVGDDSNVGYFYAVEALTESGESDPLEALRLQLSGTVAALPAPEDKSKTESAGKTGNGKSGSKSRASAAA